MTLSCLLFSDNQSSPQSQPPPHSLPMPFPHGEQILASCGQAYAKHLYDKPCHPCPSCHSEPQQDRYIRSRSSHSASLWARRMMLDFVDAGSLFPCSRNASQGLGRSWEQSSKDVKLPSLFSLVLPCTTKSSCSRYDSFIHRTTIYDLFIFFCGYLNTLSTIHRPR